MATYTNFLKYTQPQVGGPADIGTWGNELNTDLQLIENVAIGVPGIAIGGLTTYTLSVNNGATDDYKAAIWKFTGALSGTCTVTIPSNIRPFAVVNATTGGFNVILTTGSGSTFTVAPNSNTYFGFCDGTNTTWTQWAASATNDSATAGTIGEYVASNVPGSTVSMSTGVAANMTSISLGAGDWDVWGNVIFIPAGTTTVQSIVAGISTSTGAFAANNGSGGQQSLQASFTTGASQLISAGQSRQSLSATTTVFLVAQIGFLISTCTAGGGIFARRAR